MTWIELIAVTVFGLFVTGIVRGQCPCQTAQTGACGTCCGCPFCACGTCDCPLSHVGADVKPVPFNLIVHCPPDAALIVNGYVTAQEGSERIFVTESLATTRTFKVCCVYRWGGGYKYREEKEITVYPGGNGTLCFGGYVPPMPPVD